MTAPLLRRVVVERLPNGRWKLVRERDETGETFYCDDLLECWETVDAAYRPDGTPREWPGATQLCGETRKGDQRT